VLAPTVTRLDKRVLYVTYDIASALQPGDNCIALWTGAGWGRYEFFKSKAALRVQLNGKTTGGQPITLASDTTWRCQISNSEDIGKDEYRNHGGEQIDASKYDPHWNTVDCDDSAWPQAVEVPVKQTLSAQMVEPSRFIETIPAQTISGDGPYKVVLAKNFSGWVTINVKGQSPGDPIKIQVSDNLGVVQNFAQLNTYTCSGAPSETFQNRFNYTAGRYVTITGLKNKPELADIEGHAIGTDFNRVGHFTCSSDLFNQIYETDLWTYRANTVEGYTEDCPHRERLGYGEEQFATAWGCGLPNYQTGAFYTNVLRNWRDVQQSNGWFNHTAPQVNRHYGGPMWSSAPLNIGWEFYKTYGDKRALADAYASDKSWIDFLGANVTDGLLQPYNKNYNNGGNFLGDWAAPYGPSDKLKGKEFGTTPEAQLFNNCVYAMNLETVIEMAKVLDKPDDVATYSKRLDDLKHRVHARFFNPQDNNYFDNHQMHLAFPMFVGITSDAVKPAVLANFDEESLQTHPYLNMGSSGLPVLLKFLIENAERNDILFADLSSKVEPGYGYFLARGETAWPEYWDDNCPSRIHTCYTGIASWFIKGLGGIREDPAQFGYQSFIIKPAIVGDLTYAEAKTESLYGPIISRWEKNDAAIQMNVTIPANSTATVYVPAKDVAKVIEGGTPASQSPGIQFLKMESSYAVFQVQSGVYQFNAK
jgi:alpha-L-rhamnosidase